VPFSTTSLKSLHHSESSKKGHRELGFIRDLTMQQVLVTLAMAIICTLMAVLFFLKGLQIIGASRAALIGTAELVFCLLIAFIVLGETLNLMEFLGSLMVFISVLLVVYSRPSASETNKSDLIKETD
jgi:drug/metabolite transporter (DMT)-like permease